ncbi:MAG: hypothetical protein IKC52_01500 [Clostridia bacterium]|nr:hypothetical protein [Clostridia bacterium]MBR2966134.1 hypothetical protein [Clostridia bacterium]
MNMYVIFATFLVCSAIVLLCLDHLKMRVARNLFVVLTLVMILYIPIAIWGSDIVYFCVQHQGSSFVDTVVAFTNKAISVSNMAFASVTLLLSVLALVGSVACIIVVVQTAKAICKFVQKLQQKPQQKPQHPQKKTYEPKLVHSTIQYKRILYLRLCRLNS